MDGHRIAEPHALSGIETIRMGETLLSLFLEAPEAPPDDPEEVLVALAEGELPASPAERRRFGRAAVEAVRSARHVAQVGMGVAAVAVLVAIGAGALALSGTGDPEATKGDAESEDIVKAARPSTVLVTSKDQGGPVGRHRRGDRRAHELPRDRV